MSSCSSSCCDCRNVLPPALNNIAFIGQLATFQHVLTTALQASAQDAAVGRLANRLRRTFPALHSQAPRGMQGPLLYTCCQQTLELCTRFSHPAKQPVAPSLPCTVRPCSRAGWQAWPRGPFRCQVTLSWRLMWHVSAPGGAQRPSPVPTTTSGRCMVSCSPSRSQHRRWQQRGTGKRAPTRATGCLATA